MLVLAIETSCDEAAAAVLEGEVGKPIRVLAEAVASSEEMHVKTGGIVPEVAGREQIKSIIPVIQDLGFKIQDIDAIAVTVGPGLVGSLLVGVETAKALALAWEKPLVPVNHLVAHLYANWVSESNKKQVTSDKVPRFPAIGLVISGGHTDLVLMNEPGKIKYLGGTRDDAAGECFDKSARVLGLGYPGGPAIAAAASKFKIQNSKIKSRLPRPMINSGDYDFSFSGLKTALLRFWELRKGKRDLVGLLAFELQEAVVDILVAKLEKAVKEFKPRSVLVGGGVAANLRLRRKLEFSISNLQFSPKLFISPLSLCTDNAVMIGATAIYNYSPIEVNEVGVEPGLLIT